MTSEHQLLEVGPQGNVVDPRHECGPEKSAVNCGLDKLDSEETAFENGSLMCEKIDYEIQGTIGPSKSLSMVGDMPEAQLDNGPIILPTKLKEHTGKVNEIENCPNLVRKKHDQLSSFNSGMTCEPSDSMRGDDEEQSLNSLTIRGNCKKKSKLIEKRLEREKWSTFVGEMISEDDREAARKDLCSVASQRFVCKGIEQNREDAEKVWEFGKKIGIASIENDADMVDKLLKLHETERVIDGKDKETQIIDF